MNLYMRLLGVLLAALSGRRLPLLGESCLRLRVWPGDLDLNGHVNNGRYLTLSDLGRMDLLLRCGLLKTMVQRRWRPVVGTVAVRFHRGLRPLERYELLTRIVGWNEKWTFIEHRFLRRGELCAAVLVKGLFVGPGGRVPMAEIAVALGVAGPSPDLPEAVRHLAQAESAWRGSAEAAR